MINENNDASYTGIKSDNIESRQLGVWSGVNMIVGMMIGGGVFSSAGPLLSYAGSPIAALITWLLAGFLAIFGALCYSELGTLIPKSGGEQAYLEYTIGDLPSYVFSVFSCFIGKPCSIAIILIVSGEYAQKIVLGSASDDIFWFKKLAAIFFLTALTVMNIRSSKAGVLFQNISTVFKLFALILICLSGLSIPIRNKEIATKDFFDKVGTLDIGTAVFALYQGLWAYDGWNNLNFIASELKDPAKNLPLSIGIGLPFVIILYMLANLSYFFVLTPNEIAGSITVASQYGQALFGSVGVILMAIFVVLSTLGSANASIYTSSRLLQSAAMKKHVLFSQYLSPNDPKFDTPMMALLFQYLMTIIYILAGEFDLLVNIYSWVAWIFFGLTASCVFILRYRSPGLNRPFKAPSWIAVCFIATSVLLFFVPIITHPFDIILGAILVIASVLIYMIKQKIPLYNRLGDEANEIELNS